MSLITTYQNSIKRKKDELNRLKEQKIRYMSDKSNKKSKINTATRSMNRTKLQSVIKSRIREIERYERDVQSLEKKIAETEKKITNKQKEINNDEKKLQREQIREDKKIELERINQQKSIDSEIKNLNIKQNSLQQEVIKLKESKQKITILFLASNPKCEYKDENGEIKEMQKLDLDKEAREIRESIIKSLNRDSIDFQTRWATRVQDIFQAINETNPTIVHFSGHGSTDGELVFQDNNDKPKFVSNEAIAEMIAASSDDIRMIVFNNCFSSNQAEIIVKKVEATIGMNQSIKDETAILFSSQLYSAIGFGLSLEKAFGQARARLIAENTNEENIPELYVKDGIEAKDIIFVK